MPKSGTQLHGHAGNIPITYPPTQKAETVNIATLEFCLGIMVIGRHGRANKGAADDVTGAAAVMTGAAASK
jgi:hypothetical protein